MKNSKLVEEAKSNPGRIYRHPHDVLRDRRLDDDGRLQILAEWEQVVRNSHEEAALGLEDSLAAARREVEDRLAGGQSVFEVTGA